MTSARGDRVQVPDMENGYERRVVGDPQRSSRAEVPGQVEIDVVRLTISADCPGLGVSAMIYWRERWWDVAAPPAYHHGTRHVRHVAVDVRARPDGTEPDAPPQTV